MTQLLEKVLTEVHKLPPEKQDAIAAVILEELEDAQLWDKAFPNHRISSLNLRRRFVLISKRGALERWALTSCELISNG